MKVTVENKKGLNKDLKVFVDKKTIETYMNEKYEEVKKQVSLKGFRPGKAPKEILKRQFGKSIYGEVLDKVLKETSAKAIQENKIKPAGQPKIDLKSYGEGKDLEYIISVTEFPKVELKSIENIKIDEYTVKIDSKDIDFPNLPISIFIYDVGAAAKDIGADDVNEGIATFLVGLKPAFCFKAPSGSRRILL